MTDAKRIRANELSEEMKNLETEIDDLKYGLNYYHHGVVTISHTIGIRNRNKQLKEFKFGLKYVSLQKKILVAELFEKEQKYLEITKEYAEL